MDSVGIDHHCCLDDSIYVCISGSNNNKLSLLKPRVLTLDLRCSVYAYVYVKSTRAAMGKQFLD